MKNYLLSSFLLLVSVVMFAQKGVVSGNVIDNETGEELIGVTVVIQGTTQGAITDFSGNYRLELDPGTYNLEYNYLSYQKQVIEGLTVTAGNLQRLDVSLVSDDVQLQEVVVQASAINNNDVALLKLQKKAYAVQDGISAAEIGRLGASNSAESMKQVTGATIEDGKYVVMRGLGDRYSITQMNGVTLPSTDPYRNSSSMDLIPTSMVENIVTKKTFTPDQPGNFTGGNVNITTKPIPDEFYLQAGAQVGYNTQSSFNNEFLSDPIKGDKDFWGYDDGSRAIDPFLVRPDVFETLSNSSIYTKARNPNEPNSTRDIFNGAAQRLNQPVFVPVEKNVGMNSKFTFAFGDRKPMGKGKLGYNFGLSMNRDFTHLENSQFNRWEYSSSAGATELGKLVEIHGNQSLESTTVSGLAGLAYQFNDFNEISVDYIYNHDGEFNSLSMEGDWPAAISGPHIFQNRANQFTDRQLQNLRVSGNHVLKNLNNLELEWTGARILSTQDRPDIRLFFNDIKNGTYGLTAAEYDLPFHFWRELEDIQYTGKLDITIPLNEKKSNQLKFGGLYTTMDRDFAEIRYQQRAQGTIQTEDGVNPYVWFGKAAGDFDTYFDPSNAGTFNELVPPANAAYYLGNWYQNTTLLQNEYVGNQTIIAGYGMFVYNFTEKLKLIGGARVEKTDMETITPTKTSQGADSTIVGQIDDLDILPSVNLIFALNDQSNLRLSGSQTLARPNLREMAPFTSPSLNAGESTTGNPGLTKSKILNLDLRYEVFMKPGELFAVSAFYKNFQDPIAQLLRTTGSGIDITWENVNDANLYGLEFEYRKSLDFISPSLENFNLGTNFTYTYSRVALDELEYENGKEVNPDLKKWRPFQAQSPYIWNLNLSYLNFEQGIESAISMNVYGRRLARNGKAGVPDLYEINGEGNKPVPTLNFTFAKDIGEHFNAIFKATNLLNAYTETNQEFNNQYFINNRYRKGATFSLGLRYRI